METRTIVCDQCGADLTYGGRNRIVLRAEGRADYPGYAASCDVAYSRLLDRAYHFCDKPCLAVWTASAVPDAAGQYYDHVRNAAWWAAGQPHGSTPEYAAYEKEWPKRPRPVRSGG